MALSEEFRCHFATQFLDLRESDFSRVCHQLLIGTKTNRHELRDERSRGAPAEYNLEPSIGAFTGVIGGTRGQSGLGGPRSIAL